MKVTGFSFIRNAILFDFPVIEAIRSILPLCDEVVVAVGDSEDATRELIAAIDPKIRIIDTIWDPAKKTGGVVLADETNKAFQAISPDADWCVYIQGDEVMHEESLDTVRKNMLRWKDDKNVDGLLFKYRHFYGSYDYIGTSSQWYKKEIRVIKNNKNIYSYLDAQGFRKNENEKLNVKEMDAYIHHYGWVREPSAMMAKVNNSGRFWGGDAFTEEKEQKVFEGKFDYSQIDALEKYKGKHPAVMQERINRMNWQFNYDLSYNNLKLKDKLKNFLEKITGKRFFDYKNYKVV